MTISSIICTYAYCLFMTIIIELILALIIGIRDKEDIYNVIIAQILTNPALVSIQLLIRLIFESNIENYFIYPMEIIVVLVEGLFYSKKLSYKRINPYLLSLILNGCSYFLGLLIDYLI